MSIPMFLALTAEEFSQNPSLPCRPAWMSVHFSSKGPGLSNLPPQLPPGSMIILDDHIPWKDHSIESICKDLTEALLRAGVYGLLLDFERQPTEETTLLARAVTECCKELGVTLGAPANYIFDEDTALFVSPLPCNIPAESLKSQRKLWLDISPVCHCIKMSKDKAWESPATYPPRSKTEKHEIHWDDTLLCSYFTESDDDTLKITLFRDTEDAWRLLKRLDPARVQLALGLWRDFAPDRRNA